MAAEVQIYVTNWCGYCSAAEALLKDSGANYQRIDVTGDKQLRQWLVQKTGRSTVPQVFINGTSVGGFDDLSFLSSQGKLLRMLAQDPPPPNPDDE